MAQYLPHSLSDEDVVKLYCLTAEAHYYTLLYNRYTRKVYHKCLSITRDEELARDYTQDIFLRLLTKLNKFEGRATFSTWLFTLTRNYCVTQIRSVRTRSEELTEEYNSVYMAEDQDQTDYRLSALQQAISTLTLKEIEILRMKYFDDLEMTQISKELSLNVSAVKMRLKRSRDKLRTRMEQIDTFL
ncbi:RNA polymerase sigma factor [Arsenicibacter rosenii]|uniref:RNA polymerase subunit sigma-24 n=1 Tax=Arsenicibacter rosenii TaxID=1750698 RepID=A0A1S2VQX6_9BACT|nr:sigma-70 family RNA polymerase sigma factor [Arsenicibacter rosenii]OIN61144.1 hypothetical protein BLX24_03530 [Arsenicibacter rosenii]